MTKVDENIQTAQNMMSWIVERCYELEEENKTLNIKVASLEWEIKWLNSVIDKLREENQTLELWLDNKEKVNKSLREENKKLKKYYDRDKEELMESCYSLAKENDKLKSDLEECECSMHFENDEVWYRKRECKKLKEKVRFLEECLDRKEKLNEKYRKELKSTYVYDAKQVRDIC